MKEESLKYALSKGNDAIKGMRNQKTAKQYQRNIDKFVKWAAGQGIKRLSQLIAQYGDYQTAIQAWADHLAAQGKAASTIHTYLAGVCKATGVSIDAINKPKRITSENTRSRTGPGRNDRSQAEIDGGKYDPLIDFQVRVGLRRAELARLTGNDLVTDEAGNTCVYVRKGKGGKEQLQVILPDDVQAVSSYFTGTDSKLFDNGMMDNHIDLHAMRASHARDCYTYYASLPQPAREALREDLIARYILYHPWKGHSRKAEAFRHDTEGVYRLRGANRRFAMAKGLPTEYDKLALMAVSVYHLSHWRLDVTVSNYMLSV